MCTLTRRSVSSSRSLQAKANQGLDRRADVLTSTFCQHMISGDNVGLAGSSDTTQFQTSSSIPGNRQNPNNAHMSATSLYTPTFYQAGSVFDANPSNPPLAFRRPSQPGLPVCSGQFSAISSSATINVSNHSENISRENVGPPLPPSTLTQRHTPRTSPPVPFVPRSDSAMTISPTISQPHHRIGTPTQSAIQIGPEIHMDIANFPVSDIVAMLAAKLQNVISISDRQRRTSFSSGGAVLPTAPATTKESRLLSFHARNIPSITVTAYLHRILRYCPTDPEVFISVLVYFDRILRLTSPRARPIFGQYFQYPILPTLGEISSDDFAIDSFNVHRLVITTIAVATKFFSDQFYTNSRYARVVSSWKRLT
jgi:PHO85 cyclin-6/7